ncbi:hypothetical protein D8674_005483 [Pyrus ussuriensis x Pyrus communis]|uniref:Uncharacterized protein n=1 Tax=Pyrus ussuriensis x Pyrus communis TaxID=2448454 RepID=A0A5N5FRL0_9ROSA|nr:hypothetical protein D8674_005483 [Pyrus ussuriensis x Pyrus communis]
MHETNVAGAVRMSKCGRQDQVWQGAKAQQMSTGAASLHETQGSKVKVCGRLGRQW